MNEEPAKYLDGVILGHEIEEGGREDSVILAQSPASAPLSEALRELITPANIRRFTRVVQEGMEATTVMKDGSIGPDWTNRHRFCVLFISYAEGNPINRQQIVTKNIPTNENLEESVLNSPAALARLKEIVAKGELKHGQRTGPGRPSDLSLLQRHGEEVLKTSHPEVYERLVRKGTITPSEPSH